MAKCCKLLNETTYFLSLPNGYTIKIVCAMQTVLDALK